MVRDKLLAAGDRNQLWLWDVEAGAVLHKIDAPQVTCVAFSPDGQQLAVLVHIAETQLG